MKNCQYILTTLILLLSLTNTYSATPKNDNLILKQKKSVKSTIIEDIQKLVNSNSSKPITAYDIAKQFKPRGETQTEGLEATTSTTFGTAKRFSTGTVAKNYPHMSIAALSRTRFVIVFMDEDNSDHGVAVVGQVSGTNITYGSLNTFNAESTNSLSVAALTNTSFVVVFTDANSKGTAMIGQVSGNNITSYSSEYIYNNAITRLNKVAALNSTKIVISYTDTGNSWRGTSIIGQIGGTTITFGNEYPFVSGGQSGFITMDALSSTKFVVAYRDGNNSHKGTAIVGQVSGTIIIYGTPAVFYNSNTVQISLAALSSTKFAVVYQKNGATVVVGEVSGTSITYGTESAFSMGSAVFLSHDAITVMSDSKIAIAYRISFVGYVIIGTISGTSITFGTTEQFTTNTDYPFITSLTNDIIGPPTSDDTHYVIAYNNKGNSDDGYGMVGDATSAVLPVELSHFEGENTPQGNVLKWQTVSEINNEGFEIERSGDGKNWEIIDFVQGNGTTTEMQNYQFIDNSPFKGTNYYRLRQIDFDGQYEYSDIINITIELFGNKTIQFFPNPVTNQLNIQNMEEVVNVAIYNTLGQLVQQQVIQPNSTNLLTIDTQSLPSNSYILQLQKQDGNMESHQFIKH